MKHTFRTVLLLTLSLITLTVSAQNAEVEGGLITDSIWIQNLPAFRAELSMDYELSAFPDDTLIVSSNWDDSSTGDHLTTYDEAGDFNASNGVFTAPRTGLYYMEANLHFKSPFFLEDLVFACLAINGSITNNCIKASYALWSTGNTNFGPIPARKSKNFSGVVKLDKGDKVKFHLGYNDDFGGGSQLYLEKYSSLSSYLITDLN